MAYPVIHDGVSAARSNQYGKKAVELTDSMYRTFAAPFLSALQRPYQYVQPYVKKADDLGDKTLSKVDEKFPIVKKPTGELVNDAKTIAYFPIRIGQSGTEHILNTYNEELQSAGGNTIVAQGKALLATALVLTAQTYTTINNFLRQTKSTVKEQAQNAQANN